MTRRAVFGRPSSRARFLLAKLNPSATYNSSGAMGGGGGGGGDIIFTDDVSLQAGACTRPHLSST